MNRFSKSRKKGFSLVEMVLAIAIVVMIGGVIAGLCASISNSFITTYNIDDASDYALLYAKAFENSFIANSQVYDSDHASLKGMTWKWYVNDPENDGNSDVPTLRVVTPNKVDSAVFTPTHMGNSATSYKWSVRMFYKYNSTDNSVDYVIFIKDAYTDTNFVYMYEDRFWLPRYADRATFCGVEATRKVEVKGDEMKKTTFQSGSDLAKYTNDQYARIQTYVDAHPGYYSAIEYTWG
jgi:type II secretory pathway pseudopilin PulG